MVHYKQVKIIIDTSSLDEVILDVIVQYYVFSDPMVTD